MTRISKQAERRQVSFRKNKKPARKTGPLKDQLPLGYKAHSNALEGTPLGDSMFISKVK